MTGPTGLPGRGKQPTTSAAVTVTGRIFLLDSSRHTHRVPPFLTGDRSGLVLCGKDGNTKADVLWRQSAGPLLIDPAAYVHEVATADEPFALPESDDALFGTNVNVLLDGQRQCHAAAAMTPSRYVQAGDSAALKALVHHAQAIERDDVIVAVPVALSWLTKDQYLPQLIAGLKRIPHPKAVMFGAQKNPFDVAAATPNFRRLLAETTNVGLWRADVPAAFDCLAHGGMFAAIGAGGSLRHLVPADEKPDANNPVVHTPAVLLPSMLRYSEGRFIANKYASTPAPRCDCPVCDGASLDRFDSTSSEVRIAAHAHNAAVWTGWLADLFNHTTDAERRLWWRGFCQAAVDAHEQENTRLRQKGAFKPSPALRRLAKLPLPGEVDYPS
jgi:hypothetical protein